MFTPAELAAMHQYGVTPPVVTPQMLEYAHLRYILTVVRELYVIASLWLILQLGWAAKLEKLCRIVSSVRFVQLAAFVGILSLLIMLLRLPFNIYSSFYVEHAFGLSQQSFGSWLGDLLIMRVVDLAISIPLWALVFLLFERFPKRWPLILWAAMTPIIAAAILLWPWLVDPLINKYSSMPPGELRAAIETMSEQAGLTDAHIYVVDKSKQTNKINAYVTGLGPSARIVIWDTSYKKLPKDELLSMVGHELGHYINGHVLKGFLLLDAALLAACVFVAFFQKRCLGILPKSWGVTSGVDLTMIPTLMLLGSILGLLTAPVENVVSRSMERESDEFGLSLTQNRGAMARLFVSLSKDNLSEPDPPVWFQMWFGSHPTLRERIDFSLGIKR